MKTTPRQELERLDEKNGKEGFYGTANQFAMLIRSNIEEKSHKLLGQIFNGYLPSNERMEYNKIYNMLLDGKSMKAIKDSYKSI